MILAHQHARDMRRDKADEADGADKGHGRGGEQGHQPEQLDPKPLDIDAYGGLVNRMPAYALIFMFFTMANVGLPGTSGFVGEFLTLMGMFQYNTWIAAIATSGVIFSAAYALWLYRRVVFGQLIKEALKTIEDMTAREKWIMAPLITMTLLLGVYPALVLDVIGPSVENLLTNYHAALGSAADHGVAAVTTH